MKKFLFLIIIILFFSSCFLKKTPGIKKTALSFSDIPSLSVQYPDIENVSSSFSFSFQHPTSSMSGFGKIQIVLDSSILVSLKSNFGMTLANVLLVPDSAIVYVPLMNKYKSLSYKELTNIYGFAFNYYSFQSLFLANFFVYPFFVSADSATFYTDSLLHFNNKIYSKDVKDKLFVDHSVDFKLSTFLIKNILINDLLLHKDYYISYSNYLQIDNIYFPHSLKINYSTVDTVNIDLKFKNVRLNSSNLKKFNLPSNAKILDF